MVLADTLALAAKQKPAAIIDFATLTGSMIVALGDRMSGVISNRDELAERAVKAGKETGERVVAFPMPEDYDEALDSPVADVKQCTLDGEADHILAARFLNRFVADTPWLHVDLSASRCKGGLGAAASDINGFGVALGLQLVEGLMRD
jgi:leucyl aminopeptidase